MIEEAILYLKTKRDCKSSSFKTLDITTQIKKQQTNQVLFQAVKSNRILNVKRKELLLSIFCVRFFLLIQTYCTIIKSLNVDY